MRDKKTVLIICSGLDLEKNIGSVFWEQAGFVKDDYNIILCAFKKNNLGPRKALNYLKANKIERLYSPNKISIFYINYPFIRLLPERFNVFLYKFYIRSFYNFLKTEGIVVSLIHAQNIFNAGIEAFYLHEVTEIPFIFTEHNQLTLRNRTKYEQLQVEKVLVNAGKKLVVSFDKIRQFSANGYYGNFEVVGNGVDSEYFFYDPDVDFGSSSDFKIITIGAFNPIKDQETILKALQHIDKKIRKKVKFTWIGYDSWGKNGTRAVSALLDNYVFNNVKVEIIPKMTRPEIAEELKDSNLFIFSSISEGLPISVLEALASGVPVCSTRCGGVDEIIDSHNGKIVQIKDYQAMGNFVLSVIEEEKTFDRKKISQNILQKYGDKVFGRRIKEIYSSLVNDQRK